MATDRKDATSNQVKTVLAGDGVEEVYTPTAREIREQMSREAAARRKEYPSAIEVRDREADRRRLRRQTIQQLYDELGHLPSRRQVNQRLNQQR
ncbi:MAG TPA: hypothetical protein VEW42_03785 [Candidatus Eisenbacteria bacterium]|nr:hypothetical protein [Candidatus Eisenbacteria bacterium]